MGGQTQGRGKTDATATTAQRQTVRFRPSTLHLKPHLVMSCPPFPCLFVHALRAAGCGCAQSDRGRRGRRTGGAWRRERRAAPASSRPGAGPAWLREGEKEEEERKQRTTSAQKTKATQRNAVQRSQRARGSERHGMMSQRSSLLLVCVLSLLDECSLLLVGSLASHGWSTSVMVRCDRSGHGAPLRPSVCLSGAVRWWPLRTSAPPIVGAPSAPHAALHAVWMCVRTG